MMNPFRYENNVENGKKLLNNSYSRQEQDNPLMTSAPLWRNAPQSIQQRQLSPNASKTAPVMVPVNNAIMNNNAMMMNRQQQTLSPVTKSFQQSLRSYTQQSKIKLQPTTPTSNTQTPATTAISLGTKSVKSNNDARCFVTSLAEDAKRAQENPAMNSFYLDYLEWNNQIQNQSVSSSNNHLAQQPQQFDHSKFMDMFRNSGTKIFQSTEQMDSTSTINSGRNSRHSIIVDENTNSIIDNHSLPYSVNNDVDLDSGRNETEKKIETNNNINNNNNKLKMKTKSNSIGKQITINQPSVKILSSTSPVTATARCFPTSHSSGNLRGFKHLCLNNAVQFLFYFLFNL